MFYNGSNCNVTQIPPRDLLKTTFVLLFHFITESSTTACIHKFHLQWLVPGACPWFIITIL